MMTPIPMFHYSVVDFSGNALAGDPRVTPAVRILRCLLVFTKAAHPHEAAIVHTITGSQYEISSE